MRVLAGYEEILQENKRLLSGQTSFSDFFNSSSGTVVSPTVLLDTGDVDQDDTSSQPVAQYIHITGSEITLPNTDLTHDK